MNKSAFGIGLQLTGLATCLLALMWGLADNGPAEWGLLGLAVILFIIGQQLREGDAGESA
jgi:hypothetical protein